MSGRGGNFSSRADRALGRTKAGERERGGGEKRAEAEAKEEDGKKRKKKVSGPGKKKVKKKKRTTTQRTQQCPDRPSAALMDMPSNSDAPLPFLSDHSHMLCSLFVPADLRTCR